MAAAALDGTTPLDERRDILQRLHTGDTPVVCNCGVLTEGFDAPSIHGIIMARPTQARPFSQQMLGRGTRIYPGKQDCLILDVVGVSTKHRLQTVATLFALNPVLLTEESVLEAVETQERRRHEVSSPTARESPVQSISLPEGRWRGCRRDGGRGFFSRADQGTLRLVPDGPDTWSVLHQRSGVPRIPSSYGKDCLSGMDRGLQKTSHAAWKLSVYWIPRPPGAVTRPPTDKKRCSGNAGFRLLLLLPKAKRGCCSVRS